MLCLFFDQKQALFFFFFSRRTLTATEKSRNKNIFYAPSKGISYPILTQNLRF